MSTTTDVHRMAGYLRQSLDVLATLAVIAAAGLFLVRNIQVGEGLTPRGRGITIPSEPIQLVGAVRGDPAARVVVFEFSDFECPFCGKFAREILPQLEKDYVATGKVRHVFRHNPLPSHKRATAAAISADCAGRQGKFWEMHDRLFAQERSLENADLLRKAREIGLNTDLFEACLTVQDSTTVQRDADEARSLGIHATPSFLFGLAEPDGRVRLRSSLVGAGSIEAFRDAIDDLLASSSPATAVMR